MIIVGSLINKFEKNWQNSGAWKKYSDFTKKFSLLAEWENSNFKENKKLDGQAIA